MKNIIYLTLTLFLFCLTSCEDELNEVPLTTISPNNFYQSQSDLELATLGAIGLHSSLDLYSWGIHYAQTWPAGDYKRGPGDPWENLSFESNWFFSSLLWDANYKLINNVNLALDRIDGIEFESEEKKDALKGELLFLRAVSYFDLVRLFGKVPLHLSPTVDLAGSSLPESEIAEVYEAIVDDLKMAETILGLENPYGNGYATKGSATGLLAKIYIFMAGHPLKDTSKWALALEQVKKIVDSNNPSISASPYNYSLEPDFQNLFYLVVSPAFSGSGGTGSVTIGQPANENGPEAVYEINFDQTPGLISSAFPTSVSGLLINDWLRTYFEDDDYRKQVTMVTTNTDPLGSLFLEKKFQSTGSTWNDNSNNWTYLRFANLILYLAEAENEVNGPTQIAFDALNAVRERARKGKNGEPERATPADYTTTDASTKEEFRQLLYRERVLEFACEGENWFDWIRTERLEEMINFQGRPQYYKPRLEFFPKPQAQITLGNGNLTQNTGY
ncbi:RagB/SusD family nutrient uptake outer membrane protein [Flavivirga amylovorans]|uniref:RagB/SusD family nutrient uptake outer membrane protein n=1 Tax=Flavivirga amylovorans TaxID=870486 RepID=A0ABT8X490_9FLAO|nr:RagB/SusD family nutrient uptake outer membrane protein [Flavivirga amylovorans]MDO5988523.1 RagB/SusD family nutrient uptake outer membrane protein [Flavivirga amylovorans]